MNASLDNGEKARIGLVKKCIEAQFINMNGFHRQVRTFHCGLDTPILAEVEAVSGMANREKYKATAVYLYMAGLTFRFNGKTWIRA